ncbi:YqzL family protein [Falsibacillus pallidus]|uniref:YqzL-like protein n=1 Tax=Falsibacillus pallidus TaxID=493781 RepID=A0A370GKW1_9BACI|nr:YqzL family protein [Falsibacillus pallidus]RDI44000.1 YqzL-like protein [Falsibacillus pallidus]
MLELTWKFFVQTGSIDTYLLFKELEKDNPVMPSYPDDEMTEINFPII